MRYQRPLSLCIHVRYSMYFSSISLVVFLHKCENCFTHFTSFSTAVFPPLAAPPQNHRWILWGFCECTFHNFERQRTGKKKARHLSHYLVKLDRTGKVHRDPDSFLLLPLFCGFPLRPQWKTTSNETYTWCKFMCGTTALLGSLPLL